MKSDVAQTGPDEAQDHPNTSVYSASSDEVSFSSGIYKPLNISSLTKAKKPNTSAGLPFPRRSRGSFEQEPSRPFSPDPKQFQPAAHQRKMKIATPSPFFPSTASFQPISAFRTPRVPSPTKRHSAASMEDLNANEAHTFTQDPCLPISAQPRRSPCLTSTRRVRKTVKTRLNNSSASIAVSRLVVRRMCVLLVSTKRHPSK